MNTNNVKIQNLYETPQHLPLVADWIYKEFWTHKPDYSPAFFEKLLRDAAIEHQIPLSLLATVNDVPAGTVQLIENDDEQRTHLRPWLAALIVQPEFRMNGIGSLLVRSLAGHAKQMSIENMYLGTDNPGFYNRLGAIEHENPREGFWIMRIKI
jgi:predicted N-acetyltransferase YhbS